MVLGGFVCRKLMAIKHNHIVNGVREAAPAQLASGRPSIPRWRSSLIVFAAFCIVFMTNGFLCTVFCFVGPRSV